MAPPPLHSPADGLGSQAPELSQWLRQRTLEQAEAVQQHPERLPAPAPFPQLAKHALLLSEVGELPDAGLHPAGHRLDVNVPGRKWQQIEAFASRLAFGQPTHHWLDWCSGKGHLGRRLLQPGQQLTCLEYDSDLVSAGQALSDHHHLPAVHVQQDVMAPDSARHLGGDKSAVALHACGDLHVRLLQAASQQGCQQIALAPCCYNRIQGKHYHAMSATAQASALNLTQEDLGLPLSEAVTSSLRTRRQRDTSMARRLGFDLLQRQQRGTDDYLPTPRYRLAGWQNPSSSTAATWPTSSRWC